MIQFNLSLFFEGNSHVLAIELLEKELYPKLNQLQGLESFQLYEVLGLAEPGAKTLSLQCQLLDNNEGVMEAIASLVEGVLGPQIKPAYLYFPSTLKAIKTT